MADLEEEEEQTEQQSSIEIKLISGEDLRAFNFFQRLSIFALASVDDDQHANKKRERPQQHRTPTDRHNGGFPEWNHDMRFVLASDSDSDLEHLYVRLSLRHDGVLFGIGDRTIGEVKIPVKDLADEASSGGVLRFVRYQVKGSDGRPNGVLNLSYRFISRTRKLKAQTLTREDKCLYPKVEEVPDLDLIDPSLSCYSVRFNNDWRETAPFQEIQNHRNPLAYYGDRYRLGEKWQSGNN